MIEYFLGMASAFVIAAIMATLREAERIQQTPPPTHGLDVVEVWFDEQRGQWRALIAPKPANDPGPREISIPYIMGGYLREYKFRVDAYEPSELAALIDRKIRYVRSQVNAGIAP